MKKTILAATLVLLGTSTAVFADVNQTVVDNIKKANNGRFAQANVKVIREVPLDSFKGFYEVSIDGQILVVNKNGKDAVVGEVYDLDAMKNLTAEYKASKQSEIAKVEIEKLSENNFINFEPTKEKIGTMYVFTDTTCGYCEKLHDEISKYAEGGVEVKYIPYPRGGAQEGSQGYEESKQMMCATDKKSAITALKAKTAGNTYVQASYDPKCVELVANGLKAGAEIGLTGTPFLYLSNGISIPGYQPAEQIINMFGTK